MKRTHSNKIKTAFYDVLAQYSTVSRIERLFEDEEIEASNDSQDSYSGVRRNTAHAYAKDLNLEKKEDLQLFLEVVEAFYMENENNSFLSQDELWKIFLKHLKRENIKFENGKFFMGENEFLTHDINFYTDQYGLEHVNREINRALKQAETDPEDAITATRSMIESTLKWILEQQSVAYESKDDLKPLYNKVSKSLNLSPDQHNEEIFRHILGSLKGVVTGLGSLRNEYGDSHGKGIKNYRPKERHAKLAINLSGTLCLFLIETHLRN